MNVTPLVLHPRTRRPSPRLRALGSQVYLLTVSPVRAARDGVRTFRSMLGLLLRGDMPVPR